MRNDAPKEVSDYLKDNGVTSGSGWVSACLLDDKKIFVRSRETSLSHALWLSHTTAKNRWPIVLPYGLANDLNIPYWRDV